MADPKALKANELQNDGFFGSMFGDMTPEIPKKEEKKVDVPAPKKKKEEKTDKPVTKKARASVVKAAKKETPKKKVSASIDIKKAKTKTKAAPVVKTTKIEVKETKQPPRTFGAAKKTTEEKRDSTVSADDLVKAGNKFGNAKVVRSAPNGNTAPRGRTGARPATGTKRPARPSRGVRTATGFAKKPSRGTRTATGFAKGTTKYQNGKFIKPKATPSAANKIPKIATVSSNLKKKEEITIGNMVSVKEFSEKTGVPFPELMKVMMMNKIMGGINTSLDYDTAALVGEELGIKVNKEQETVSVESILEGDLNAILELDKDVENLESRPPIITIMGHVDHGKTSLLDYLRKTNVAGGEAGGITQSIGASTITHKNQQMTFIDTPGHELFTTMRARGAKLTDVVVIIVAADDGLMPQTIESINHAKEANVPVIVAITKIDKPGANKQEDIRNNIGNYGLIPEARGGDTPVIEISSKTGQGIDDLLEHIVLQSEVLELTYNPKRNAVGVVLDAKKSAKQGIETSLIVMTGGLSIGDVVVAHNTYGKVKRMIDRRGKAIKHAKGGDPVQILGISEAPEPGCIVEGVDNEKEASKKVDAILASEEAKKSQASTLQSLIQQMNQGEKTTLKLVLKADGPTTLDALKHSINTIKCPDNVEIKVVHADIGQFTESDLALGQASEALLIGFNVRIPGALKKKAEQLKVTLKTYDIIYKLTEYLEDIAMGMLEIEMEEVVVGSLNILGVFFRKGKEMVIGGKCMSGLITNGDKFRIMREGEQIGQGNISSLQRDTESVKKVKEGYECGMKVRVSKIVEEGDQLDFVQEQEVKN